MDQRTRKLMTMDKALHTWHDVDRQYVSRKVGGRGLVSIQDSVDVSIQQDYIKKVLKKTDYNHQKQHTKDKHKQNKNFSETQKERKTILWTFQVTNNELLHEKTLTWRRKGNLKRDWISSDCSIKQRHINYVKAMIYKTQLDSRCRICCDFDESNIHLICECSTLVQREYETRYEWWRWFIGKCARSLNLTTRSNDICTTRNRNRKFDETNYFRFWDKNGSRISARRAQLVIVKKKKKKKKKNLLNSRLRRCGWAQDKTEGKRKER